MGSASVTYSGPNCPESGWHLDDWRLSLADLSAESLRAYEAGLRSFVVWAARAGMQGPSEVNRLALRRYLAYLATRRYARQSIAQRASALRRYFHWLEHRGLVLTDPAVALSAPSGGGRLPRPLSRAEVEVLLDAPTDNANGVFQPPEAVRWRDDAVLEMLYGSGLRVSELCSLNLSDVGSSSGWARVWGKGSKQRQVPVSEAALAAVKRWVKEGRPQLVREGSPKDALFLNMRGARLGTRDVRRIVDRRSPTPSHPHALRRQLPLLTCLMEVPTLELCKNFWVMPVSGRRRFTRT